MKTITYHEEGSTVTIAESETARKTAALRRFGTVTAFTTAVLVALLAPDLHNRYLDQDPTGGVLSIVSLALLAALLGFALGFSRAIRAQRWTFDAQEMELRLEQSIMGRRGSSEVVSLRDVSKLRIKEQAFYMTLGGADEVELLGGDPAELAEMTRSLARWARKYKLHLRIDQPAT